MAASPTTNKDANQIKCITEDGKESRNPYLTALKYDNDLFGKLNQDMALKAYRCFLMAAQEGEIEAYLYLGGYHLREIIPASSKEKVFFYFKKYTDMGGKKAYGMLGFMYYQGIGTEKDIEKGKYYYRKAAENGDIEAKRNLAFIETMEDIRESEE